MKGSIWDMKSPVSTCPHRKIHICNDYVVLNSAVEMHSGPARLERIWEIFDTS